MLVNCREIEKFGGSYNILFLKDQKKHCRNITQQHEKQDITKTPVSRSSEN
jgi:hypothetical protein